MNHECKIERWLLKRLFVQLTWLYGSLLNYIVFLAINLTNCRSTAVNRNCRSSTNNSMYWEHVWHSVSGYGRRLVILYSVACRSLDSHTEQLFMWFSYKIWFGIYFSILLIILGKTFFQYRWSLTWVFSNKLIFAFIFGCDLIYF